MSKSTILLVEDNEFMRDAARIGLEREGYEVVTAVSARQLEERH